MLQQKQILDLLIIDVQEALVLDQKNKALQQEKDALRQELDYHIALERSRLERIPVEERPPFPEPIDYIACLSQSLELETTRGRLNFVDNDGSVVTPPRQVD